MNITEVKEHYKYAKIVESHEGVKFEIKNMDYIDNGLGCSQYCYYYSNMTIYLPNKGFAKIVEYKTKATECKSACDLYRSYHENFHTGRKQIIIDIPLGQELDVLTFKKIEKELPNSWNEFVTDIEKTDTQFGFEFCQSWRRLNLPADLRAMQQLRLLRDCYNDGWTADWTDSKGRKEVIRFMDNEITKDWICTHSYFLNFKTADLRDKFLENFKDIIEIAKPLL